MLPLCCLQSLKKDRGSKNKNSKQIRKTRKPIHFIQSPTSTKLRYYNYFSLEHFPMDIQQLCINAINLLYNFFDFLVFEKIINVAVSWFARFNTWFVSIVRTLEGKLKWSHDMFKFYRGREVNKSVNHSFDLHLGSRRYVVLSLPAVLLFTNACILSGSSLSEKCDEIPNWNINIILLMSSRFCNRFNLRTSKLCVFFRSSWQQNHVFMGFVFLLISYWFLSNYKAAGG